ncbi:MAG: hypothetical protein KDK70_31240 [Myxococcales bacterium]|nr:hypothetical protein [Myxococcales bacterium]
MRIDELGTISKWAVAGVSLGILAGACLPSASEGERGVQCWTEQHTARHDCNVDYILCVDGLRPDDFEGFSDCGSDAERCYFDAGEVAKQCEQRSGCIGELVDCSEECSSQPNPSSSCWTECGFRFESCAPWYERDCESTCGRINAQCIDDVVDVDDSLRCENEHYDCLLECY